MKIKILLSLIVAFTIYTKELKAQFTSVWNDIYAHAGGNNFSAEGRKVVVDSNGNTFILCDVTSDTDLSGNPSPNTMYYVVVLKYNINGIRTAETTINVLGHTTTGFTSKSAFGIGLDATGNVYVGYNFMDPFNGSDIRVSKFNNSLVLQWDLKFNPASNDYGESLIINGSGVAYIIGKSVSGNASTYKLLKSDNSLLSLNEIYSFDSNLEFVNAFILDNQNNIYVTGYRLISNVKNFMSASISNSGSLVWKSITNGGSSSRDDFGTNLTMSTDGYLYVIGSSDRGSVIGASNYDATVIKHYAPTGKRMFEQYYNFNNADQGLFIQEINPGYLLFASASINTVLINRISSADGLLSGRYLFNPKPVSSFLNVSAASITDFKISSNQRIYITGTISASDPGGNSFNAAYLNKFALITGSRSGFSLLEEANPDGDEGSNYHSVGFAINYTNNSIVWLRDNFYPYATHLKEFVDVTAFNSAYSTKFGIASNTNNKVKTEVFPTITSDFVNISTTQPIVSVLIYNAAGKLVFEENSENSNSRKYDISNLQNGIYFLHVKTLDQITTNHKIIRQ